MSTHLPRPVNIPERTLDRSIYVMLGLDPKRLDDPRNCRSCGRPVEIYRPVAGPSVLCAWCERTESRTLYAGYLHNQLIHARRNTFRSREWTCTASGADGSAWRNDSRGLMVVEGLGLEHRDRDTMADTVEATLALPPTVERSAGDRFNVLVRSRAGQVVYQANLDATPELVALDAEGMATVRPDGAAIRDAILSWHRAAGWEWWHHLAITSTSKARALAAGDVLFAKQQFVTPEREAYQVFPATAHVQPDHPEVVHLWHTLEPDAGDYGRITPDFDRRVWGVTLR
jgi:hypothetical protein